MMTTATHNVHDTTTARVLFMAFKLSEKPWKLGFTTGPGQKPRERTVAACALARLLQEIAQAKKRLGLPEPALVSSCYAAGRAGFWLHRFVQAHGLTHPVVDASALAVNRRQRQAKSAGLDVRQLVSLLMRYEHGERDVWRVGHVPLVRAFCAWRDLQNRREGGGFAGLPPTPYQSGESAREQGITQAGHRHVRRMTTGPGYKPDGSCPRVTDAALRLACE